MNTKPMILFYSLLLLACSKGGDVTDTPVPPAPVTPPPVVIAPLRTVNVRTSGELKAALLDAQPGDEIVLADGVYNGRFIADVGHPGTAAHPITLRGTRAAILDGGDVTGGYVLHLNADYWTIRGFSVRNALKGIMADSIHYTTIDSVRVSDIGEEGIHLRRFSSHNVVRRCEVGNTGLYTPDYGEGIYVGSAKNNWPVYTAGNPDRSDSNELLDNFIGPGVAAECIDIKEGTTGGLVRGNHFNSQGITGANAADSWIDVKGNYWRIENNVGTNPAGSLLVDGYQVHVASEGWGNYNEFKGNDCTVNAGGYGVRVSLVSTNGLAVGNKVKVDNLVTGAALGVSNIPLSQ